MTGRAFDFKPILPRDPSIIPFNARKHSVGCRDASGFTAQSVMNDVPVYPMVTLIEQIGFLFNIFSPIALRGFELILTICIIPSLNKITMID